LPVPLILRNQKRLALGAALIIFDICLYGLLHDITSLAAFSQFKQSAALSFYRNFQTNFHSIFSDFLFFTFLNNYFVDAIWATALLLILDGIGCAKAAPCITFACGAASELTQALCPRLGTFDIVDLALYAAICGIWLLFCKRKKAIR
jgi:hypothetical protein